MVIGANKILSWYSVSLVVLLVVSALIRFWNIDSFPYAIFDESQNAIMATQYIAGRPFVDVHPPVARFHFAAVAFLSGASGEHRFVDILPAFNDFPYVSLRVVSALAGILLTLFVFLLTYQISGSPTAGLIAGFFVAFENSFVLYSRLILPDMLLLTYGVAGLWCFFKTYGSLHHKRWLLGAVILFSLAVGVKVTGYVFPAVAIFHSFFRSPVKNIAYSHKVIGYLLIIPFLVSSLLLFTHFLLLSPEGSVFSVGSDLSIDVFDSVRERNFFNQFGYLPGRITQRIGEVVIAQLITISGVSVRGGNATSSPVWWWPFMHRIMFFSEFKQDGVIGSIYLIGNFVIWWGGLVALVLALYRRIKQRFSYQTMDPFLFGYFFYLLVMSFIGRSLYLYLYFPALLFLIVILAIELNRVGRKHPFFSVVFLVIVFVSFIYVAPFTYGWPLTQAELDVRMSTPFWNLLDGKQL